MPVVKPSYWGHSEEEIQQVRLLFTKWDLNQDGAVSLSELKTVIQGLDPTFPDQDLSRMFHAADSNNDGHIDVDEFISWIFASEEQVDRRSDNIDLKTNTAMCQYDPCAEPPKENVKPSQESPVVESKPQKKEGLAGRPDNKNAKEKKAHKPHGPSTTDEKRPSSRQGLHPSPSPKPSRPSSPNPSGRRPSTSPQPSDRRPSREPSPNPNRRPSRERGNALHPNAGAEHHLDAPTAASQAHHPHNTAVTNAVRLDCSHHEERLKEEKLTSMEELWETLLGLRSRIPTSEIVDLFEYAWEQDFHSLFPHTTTNSKEILCDPLTTAQVVSMAIQLNINPHVPTEDLYRKALLEAPNYSSKVEDKMQELTGNDSFELKVFRNLVKHISILMRIDEQTIVSHLIWVKLKRFELTDPQFDLLVGLVAKARPREHKNKAKLVIDNSDFEVLCRHGDLIDPEGKEGMIVAEAYSFFEHTLENISRYIKEREQNHPGLFHEVHFCHHRHVLRGGGSGGGNGIVGRTEMSIFLQEFWRLGPHRGDFRTPLLLCKALSGLHRHRGDFENRNASKRASKS